MSKNAPRPGARNESADLIEIAEKLQTIAGNLGAQRQLDRGLINAGAQTNIQVFGHPHQNAAADHFQEPLKGE